MTKFISLIFFIGFSMFCNLFFSCATSQLQPTIAQKNNSIQHIEKTHDKKDDFLFLFTFSGDLMAHTVNFNMKDYDIIYADILDVIKNDDFSFTNLETPVTSSRPFESYPTFNVQSSYAKAAIKAGFDVFSLANNHTNDQGLQGIKETQTFFENERKNGIYNSGLRTKKNNLYNHDTLNYDIIEKNGIKILFVAYTEIINALQATEYFNYYQYTSSGKKKIKHDLQKVIKNIPHDIMILSVHTYEPEYVRTVTQKRKNWFYELLDCGVDIIWANHPHVSQDWELVATQSKNKLIMYSVGNLISGQQWTLNYENPAHEREYTGNSFLFSVLYNKQGVIGIEPQLILTYIDKNRQYIIKHFNKKFINSLSQKQNEYYTQRLTLMQEIKGTALWK